MVSNYYNARSIAERVERGAHRDVIGGMWDEIGSLQLDFLRSQGLQPHHTLLDIGCGSLRLGVRAVDYLEHGRYWGTDLNESLMAAGYEREIVPAGLADKLPRGQLLVDADFALEGVPTHVDFIIAASVFTHLPLNHLRLCLFRLANHIESNCVFYFTIFVPPREADVAEPHEQVPGIVTYGHRDPYHCLATDPGWLARSSPWRIRYIGDWGHPRNQKMVCANLGRIPTLGDLARRIAGPVRSRWRRH